MRRREFIPLVGGAALAGLRRVSAEPTGRSYRVGWIGVNDSFAEPYWLVLVQRLGELGFVEGRNLTIERLHADGKLERLPALAAESRSSNVTSFLAVATKLTWQRWRNPTATRRSSSWL